MSIQCPELLCPKEKQITEVNECCNYCEGKILHKAYVSDKENVCNLRYFAFISKTGTDYCDLGHLCHEKAECVNLRTKYGCQCKKGFQGDGFNCSGMRIYYI
jgi:hypothetical protein